MKIRILFLKPNQWNVKNCITQWGQRHFEVAYVYKIIIVLVEEMLSSKINALVSLWQWNFFDGRPEGLKIRGCQYHLVGIICPIG